MFNLLNSTYLPPYVYLFLETSIIGGRKYQGILDNIWWCVYIYFNPCEEGRKVTGVCHYYLKPY